VRELSPHTKQVYSILKNLFGEGLTIGREDSGSLEDYLAVVCHAAACAINSKIELDSESIALDFVREHTKKYLDNERIAQDLHERSLREQLVRASLESETRHS